MDSHSGMDTRLKQEIWVRLCMATLLGLGSAFLIDDLIHESKMGPLVLSRAIAFTTTAILFGFTAVFILCQLVLPKRLGFIPWIVRPPRRLSGREISALASVVTTFLTLGYVSWYCDYTGIFLSLFLAWIGVVIVCCWIVSR